MKYRIESTTPSADAAILEFLRINNIPYEYAVGVASEGPARASAQYIVDTDEKAMDHLQFLFETINATDYLWRDKLSKYTKIEKL